MDPGDPTAAAEGAARGAATLSLGLEAVARGSTEAGLGVLASISLARLHQVGFGITFKLSRALELLGPAAERADGHHRHLAAALRSRRPSFPRALDDPPRDGLRPIASLAEVRRLAAMLSDLGAEVQIVRDVLGADPASLPAGATLGDAGRTALVHAALGHGRATAPLGLAEIADFVRRALAGGRLSPEARAAGLSAFPPENARVVEGWMDGLERELGALDPAAPLDRRFLGGVLLE